MRATIIAYNGFDSAAAAAILLRKLPGAELLISSAARIAGTLARVDGAGAEVHILGVGARSEPRELKAQVDRLAGAGADVTWYDKGDYLRDVRGILDGRVKLVVDTKRTLPEIVCGENGIRGEDADALVACVQNHLKKGGRGEPDDRVALVQAAIERFFRQGDLAAVTDAIRKLADPALIGPADAQAIRDFQRWGNRKLTGSSAVICGIREQVEAVAADPDCPVLVTGESGTGKEIAAAMIHRLGPRVAGPLIAVSSPMLDNDLTESRLFGHEKGAFSGAIARSVGLFEDASGGTLFLDEIGDSSPSLQAKLLRAIEEKTIRRVGGRHDIETNVRLIFATNKDLAAEVKARRFREDLYYRISKIHLEMPPLRERLEDLPKLAEEILYRLATSRGQKPPTLTKQQIEILVQHAWPGNVRELEGVLTRFIVYKKGDIAGLIDRDGGKTGAPAPAPAEAKGTGDRTLREAEDDHVRRTYERHGKKIGETARVLGISQNTLKKHLRRMKLHP